MIACSLDLSRAVNRVGATFDTDRPAGELNAWGNSYPAEELPFGGQVLVDGIPYALVPKSPATTPRPDHVEALGQRLAADPAGRPVRALAVLAAGEMGPQQLSVRLHPAADGSRSMLIPGWLVRPDASTSADQLRCSHQHYPGNYDLALLVPVLWSRVLPLPGIAVTAIDLLPNPLVHVFAITLLCEGGS
jgi:hypothetical protein